jgi:hypothetical protein
MGANNWDGFAIDKLVIELRQDPGGAEGERMIWAFEQALRVARLDDQLLPHLLAAATCLLARAENSTPRAVLEAFFRRSASDATWDERYLPLFQ